MLTIINFMFHLIQNVSLVMWWTDGMTFSSLFFITWVRNEWKTISMLTRKERHHGSQFIICHFSGNTNTTTGTRVTTTLEASPTKQLLEPSKCCSSLYKHAGGNTHFTSLLNLQIKKRTLKVINVQSAAVYFYSLMCIHML